MSGFDDNIHCYSKSRETEFQEEVSTGQLAHSNREVRGYLQIASWGFGYKLNLAYSSGQGVWIVKTGLQIFRNHYRPPALQLGRATGQEGTGFQDLTLSNHSGFKDLVFFTGQLDNLKPVFRFGRWLLDIGLHWLQIFTGFFLGS